MEDIVGLLILIAIVAGVFWAGFRLGYRYRDNQSQERRKNYPRRKSAAAGEG